MDTIEKLFSVRKPLFSDAEFVAAEFRAEAIEQEFVILPLQLEPQIDVLWCWACVVACVHNYYRPSEPPIDQCTAADRLLNGGGGHCCSPDRPSRCKSKFPVACALFSMQNFQGLDGRIEFDEINRQIRRERRPVVCRQILASGDGHALIIHGSGFVSSVPHIVIADPDKNSRQGLVPFGAFSAAVQGLPFWHGTVLTRSHL